MSESSVMPRRIVKYAAPVDAIERALLFVVIEDRGDRVLIQPINGPLVDWHVVPQECVSAVDVVTVDVFS